ncbi:MAG: serine/threonine-protein kinase [Kineosporiaceae bacterium]
MPLPRAPQERASGAWLAGFEVISELGRGAQSRVLRPGSGDGASEYALKIVGTARPGTSGSGSDQALAAVRREAALLASIEHPRLSAIHEVGQAQGCPYLVMDLVEGLSLAEVLAGGALAPERVVSVALDVVEPLAAVHRKGLVHRDLKPDNIMIQPDGQALPIDFGLAAWASGDQSQAAVGTLAYSPPEQTGMLKRPVDHRSDLYSLGIVLFESLAGALPFAANEVGDLLRTHAPPPDLVQVVPGIPIGLAALVARLLAKDPDDRYQSGEELAADLHRLQADPHAPLAPPGAAGLLDVRRRPHR